MPAYEHVDLPGMPPPVLVPKPDLPPKNQKVYDHGAIMRKVTCRVDEAAAVLSCSVSRIKEFLEDGTLIGVSKSRNPSAAINNHQAVLVESIRQHIEKRRSA